MKKLLFILSLLTTTYVFAQNPYAQFGCKAVVLEEHKPQPTLTITQDGKLLSITNGLVVIQQLNDSVVVVYKIPPEQAARWLSTDPVVKHHESPYAGISNNPIWLVDPTGLDSVFYNQDGAELTALRVSNNDLFDQSFLQHMGGNVQFSGQSFYQGISRESFFGDRGEETENTLFQTLDKSTIPSVDDAIRVAGAWVPKGENAVNFLLESPETYRYDFKNSVLNRFTPQNNIHTAYLVDGIVMNRNEIGNVMWGAAANKVGISLPVAIGGVQGFTLIDEQKFDELGEQSTLMMGWVRYNSLFR